MMDMELYWKLLEAGWSKDCLKAYLEKEEEEDPE